jgi:hypothetical protein
MSNLHHLGPLALSILHLQIVCLQGIDDSFEQRRDCDSGLF